MLQRWDAFPFRREELKDFLCYLINIVYHRLLKALYQYRMPSQQARRRCLRILTATSKSAATLYPINYRSDKLVRLLLAARMVALADGLNATLWRIRKRRMR